jgi:hypothetical protein
MRYVWVDVLDEKIRVDERVESIAVVIATGVNLQSRRTQPVQQRPCCGSLEVRQLL